MLIRIPNICDVPAYSLRRPAFRLGLTATISRLADVLAADDSMGAVLDIRVLPKLRSSEVLALVEVVLAQGGRLLSAVLATPAVCAQLEPTGLSRFMQIAQSPDDLIHDPVPGLLARTHAIFLLNRRVPYLGPMARMDPETLADPSGATPWKTHLNRVIRAGVEATTVVLRPDQAALAPAIKRLSRNRQSINVILDDGDPLSLTRRLWNDGLGWTDGALVIDGWTDVSVHDLVALRSCEQTTAGQLAYVAPVSCDPDAHGAAYICDATLGRLGAWTGRWLRTLHLAKSLDLFAPVQSVKTPLDLGTLTGFSASRRSSFAAGSNSKAVHSRATVDATSVVCLGSKVAHGAVVENSVVLPGVQIESGAFVSNKIVGPDWAVDLSYAHKLPLNLAAEECASPIQVRHSAQRLAKSA